MFATHRLLRNLGSDQQESIRDAARAGFELEEVRKPSWCRVRAIPGQLRLHGLPHHLKPWRLRLNSAGEAALDEALAGRSRAYHRLDSAALEELFLKRAVGLSPEDIGAKKGLGYTPSTEEAVAALRAAPATSVLPPRSIDQVRAVAAAERRCRRSPPTSSPSCSPGSSSTRSPEHARRAHAARGIRSARGEDLHAQGGRRDHQPLVRRPGGERTPHRGIRLDRRGGGGARHS